MSEFDPEASETASPPARLGRWRSSLTVLYAAASFLAIGGFLEQWSAAPEPSARLVNQYWLLFFAFNSAAFGGAALLGALPPTAVAPVKWLWSLLLLVLYTAAFATWSQSRPSGVVPLLAAWAAKTPGYVPAATAILAGWLWQELPPLPPADAVDRGEPTRDDSSSASRQ